MFPNKAVVVSECCIGSGFSGVAFVCGLVSAEVLALDCQKIDSRDEERKANNHVEVADEVVDKQVVAVEAEGLVDAVVNLAVFHRD